MTDFLIDTDIDEICVALDRSDVLALKGKQVLITGARGFLGRYFTAVLARLNEHELREDPARVILVDNFISAGAAGARVPSVPNMVFFEANVCTPSHRMLTAPRYDYIIHGAGIASPAHYRAHPLETIDVATVGLRNVLELARANAGCRMISFSSSEIYGDPDPAHVPTREDYRGNVSCLGPRACYDESKRLGETLVRVYAERHGVHASIIRPFNVYGPGMQRTDYRALPNFAARIADGQPIEAYGDGKQTRTYCYVTDAINGFLRVLFRGHAGEPYNIGNPSPEISALELAEITREVWSYAGREVEIVTRPRPDSYPADEPQRRCPDISKARAHVGYEPRVDLRAGLGRFFAWTNEMFR